MNGGRSVHFNNGGPAQRFHALPLILPPHFLRGAEVEAEVSCGPHTPPRRPEGLLVRLTRRPHLRQSL